MAERAPDATVLFNRLLTRVRLRHLHLLVGVADQGNIQRAAERQGMSQSAATQAIAEIERVLELPLFERHARGVRLTRFGAALIPVARNAVQALQSTTDAMVKLRDGHGSVLRIGMIAAAQGLVQAALPGFIRQHPGSLLEVVESNVDPLLSQLLAGRLDLVLCRRPGSLAEVLQYVPLVEDDAVVVCSAQGALGALGATASVDLAELRHRPWLVPPEGMGARPVFDALWATQAPAPVHPVTTTSIPLLVALLRATPDAVAIAPRSLLKSYCDWGVLRALRVRLPEGVHLQLGSIGTVLPQDGGGTGVLRLCDALRRAATELS